MTTSSTPTAGSAATAAATAPSKTRPTDIVAVRYTGVSSSPHSEIWTAPVISPAPFSTATPAVSGSLKSVTGAAGTIAVTPVRATPRPVGGSGSSRTDS